MICIDGPASEFKNKYAIKILEMLAKKHNISFTRKYLARGHGYCGRQGKKLVRTTVLSNVVYLDFLNIHIMCVGGN